MRRRLTVAILAVVVGALAVAGAGSLLLVHRAVTNQTSTRLLAQARTIADNLDAFLLQRPAGSRKGVLALVTQVANLEGTAIAVIKPSGELAPIEPSAPLLGLNQPARPLPSGLASPDLRPASLLAGETVTGRHGGILFAAVPGSLSPAVLVPAQAPGAAPTATQSAREARLRRALSLLTPDGSLPIAVVVTGQVTGAPGATSYFAFAALAALVVAALVADGLGRRIVRPLREVEVAARRIAGGDLQSRLPDGAEGYPELESLARSINTMTESLERARGLERQFFMSVSHDLRTPLTSIRGWAEAIADGAAADHRRAAEIIGVEARRLERLVQDLLDLAKLDAHAFSLRLVPVDLGEVVTDTVESLRPAAEEAGLALEVAVPEPPVEVVADPDRLGQVVANLVENAYKFAGRRIQVAVARTASAPTVTVEDDGPGIPAPDLPHLFDRLYQSARTPARQAGSGLGLAIVRELCGAMGATVSVDSPLAPYGGTRMTVRLGSAWAEGPAATTGAAGTAAPAEAGTAG